VKDGPEESPLPGVTVLRSVAQIDDFYVPPVSLEAFPELSHLPPIQSDVSLWQIQCDLEGILPQGLIDQVGICNKEASQLSAEGIQVSVGVVEVA
jgi:hypothetical protein